MNADAQDILDTQNTLASWMRIHNKVQMLCSDTEAEHPIPVPADCGAFLVPRVAFFDLPIVWPSQ